MPKEVRPGVGAPGAVDDAATNDGQHSTAISPISKGRRYAGVEAIVVLLAETCPKAFSIWQVRRRPLKIGIHLDILKELDGAITPAELSNALACYTASEVYRSKLLKGAWRIDLNGEPAGVVGPQFSQEGDGKMSGTRQSLKVACKALAEFEVVPRVVSQNRHMKLRWEIGERKFQYHLSVSSSTRWQEEMVRADIRRLIRSSQP